MVQGVLGTAFPVPDANEKVFLVSAGHVLRSEMSDNHVVCALFFTRELTTRVYPIENPRFDLATDLASCPVNVDPNSGVEIVPFQITKDNVEQTQTVFVHEFSYTRSARAEAVNPAAWLDEPQGARFKLLESTHEIPRLGQVLSLLWVPDLDA